MKLGLENKVALVTGGNSGIGRATAVAFAEEGAKVVIAARDIAKCEETVSIIKEAGGDCIYVKTDVSKPADIKAMVAKTIEVYGRIDCANNNAGIEGLGLPLHDISEDEWNQLIAINLTGAWLSMKYEAIQMLKQGGGAIVNTASVAGLVGSPCPAYAASKHGVLGLTKAAALQYAQQGIRVNAVCPGFIYTPIIDRLIAKKPGFEAQALASEPAGRFGTPEECAKAIVWLCSDAASFVTGHPMVVDGGYVAR